MRRAAPRRDENGGCRPTPKPSTFYVGRCDVFGGYGRGRHDLQDIFLLRRVVVLHRPPPQRRALPNPAPGLTRGHPRGGRTRTPAPYRVPPLEPVGEVVPGTFQV